MVKTNLVRLYMGSESDSQRLGRGQHITTVSAGLGHIEHYRRLRNIREILADI